jgi:GNAT superfamily N-acetyltransferase
MFEFATALWANWFAVGLLPSATAITRASICNLGSRQREQIAGHLLSLSARDRYLRFGYTTNDHHIEQYVAGLDFVRDEILGIHDGNLLLVAVAHVAYAMGDSYSTGAEFGVSVLAPERGRGYGTRLFEQAALHATNKGVRRIVIHALSENQAMLRIATHAGARVKRHGADSEAFLELPAATGPWLSPRSSVPQLTAHGH